MSASAASVGGLPAEYRHDDEVEDKEYQETDLGAVDEQHKSVILHLLSQVSDCFKTRIYFSFACMIRISISVAVYTLQNDFGFTNNLTKASSLPMQLKMGMDLTRVVLPTFILERRSLLEMYADCMAHPNLFVNIANGRTSEGLCSQWVHGYAYIETEAGSNAKTSCHFSLAIDL